MVARLLLAAGLALLAASCAAGTRDVGRKLKVVNGKPAAQGRYPYLIGIIDRDATVPYVFCGGAIINYGTKATPGALTGKLLVTAAHCLENGKNGIYDYTQWNPTVVINPNYKITYTDEKSFVGQFPVASYANTPVLRTVYGAFPHESYQKLATTASPFGPVQPVVDILSEHDIAILVLDAPVGPPATTPAVLIPGAKTVAQKGDGAGLTAPQTLRTIGLGWTDLPTKAYPTTVQEGDIPLRKLADCQRITPPSPNGVTPYPGAVTHFSNNTRFCAGAGEGGADMSPKGVVSHCSVRQEGVFLPSFLPWFEGREGCLPTPQAECTWASAATRMAVRSPARRPDHSGSSPQRPSGPGALRTRA